MKKTPGQRINSACVDLNLALTLVTETAARKDLSGPPATPFEHGLLRQRDWLISINLELARAALNKIEEAALAQTRQA